jgi:hypothetical protein
MFGRASGAAGNNKRGKLAKERLNNCQSGGPIVSKQCRQRKTFRQQTGLPESFSSRRLRLALTPARQILAAPKMPNACGSVTNASSYGDSYEGASYACAWRFYDVYVFFRKAYCCKL